MGKAKKRKAKGTQPDLISNRLVTAWRNDTASIRVVATREAVKALEQAAHPAAARVVSNIVMLDAIPKSLESYF